MNFSLNRAGRPAYLLHAVQTQGSQEVNNYDLQYIEIINGEKVRCVTVIAAPDPDGACSILHHRLGHDHYRVVSCRKLSSEALGGAA